MWRLLLSAALLLILLASILSLAYQVIPPVRKLPNLDLPPSIQAPLHGQVPDSVIRWTKMPWGEEVRVFPTIPKYPKLEIDSSGNLLYPYD